MDQEKIKRVLVCPLGWGLGHASRDILIIDSLQKRGCSVIIAADQPQLTLLSKRFIGIKTVQFPSSKVRFSKRRNQILPLMWFALRLPFQILKEHLMLKRLVKQLNIDLVISDNRYGLWNSTVKTILITHQLNILIPFPFRFLNSIGSAFIRHVAEKFDACWIPDFSDSMGLAGELSHPKRMPSNAKYVGILSRFIGANIAPLQETWDLVGVVSGPSPQREMFISEIEKLSRKHKVKTLIIKGCPSEGSDIVEKNGIWYAGHLIDIEFASVIKSSKYLICRAGYSSIMDMVALGVKCILVPTPGQTEQEYLARRLSKMKLFNSCGQLEIENIELSVSQTIQYVPISSRELLEKIVSELAFSR
jgi:uncharacterized protein (TIGR00661 family)